MVARARGQCGLPDLTALSGGKGSCFPAAQGQLTPSRAAIKAPTPPNTTPAPMGTEFPYSGVLKD
jgi:hypothetical protein